MNNSMKIKKFASTVFALALGLGLAAGLNYVMAASQFTPPPAAFPSCDSSTVDACNTPVNVGVGSQVKNGGLAVNAFFASMDSEFAQDVKVDSLNVSSPDRTVCASPDGTLVLCNIPGGVFVSPNYGVSMKVVGIPGFTMDYSGNANVYGSHTAGGGALQIYTKWTQHALPVPDGVDLVFIVNGKAQSYCHHIEDNPPINGTSQTDWYKYGSGDTAVEMGNISVALNDSLSVAAESHDPSRNCVNY